MKRTRLAIVALILCLYSSNSSAQIFGTNGFLLSPGVEIGINGNGYEGSSALPPLPNHYRGGAWLNRMGFLANPQNDGWINYDGDFFMPGSPENRFGIEVDGVTYTNSSAMASEITSYGLSNYQIIGRCKFMDWDGSAAGIDIHMTYKLDTTDYYYTVQVTLTNTTAVDKSDVYFFKSLDPDNNQDISWGFATLNTNVFQPRSSCPKALVTATDTHDWESYIGLGGLGEEMRVAHGGFFIEDGSDIWNGLGAHDTLMGSNNGLSDDAIAICHKDAMIAAGASTTFEFVVVMDGNQVNEALMNLIYFTYEGGPAITGSCTDTTVYDEYEGETYESDGTVDTIYRCTYEPTELWVEAPAIVISEYNLAWLEEGEELGDEAYYTVLPGTEAGITHVTCYLTLGACFGGGGGLMNEYVIITRQSPELEVVDDIYCTDPVNLADVVVNDTAMVPGTVSTYHASAPEAFDDMDDLWPSAEITTGDDVYIMVVDPLTECYDVALIEIEAYLVEAGADNSTELCDFEGDILDANTLVSPDADPAGYWAEEIPSGAFNAITGAFDPAGLTGGEYTLYYIIDGTPCPNDTAEMKLIVNEFPDAGLDATYEICNSPGDEIDLNTLLSGADADGVWSELTGSGQFTLAGNFNAVDLPAGDYIFEYSVAGDAPCGSDEALFTVTIPDLPVPEFTMSPASVFTDDTEVDFDNTSLHAVNYEWNFGDGSDMTPEENPTHEFPTVAGMYEVTLYAYNELGCVDSTKKLMEVKDIVLFYIPNTFTPDGDNFNDEFKPVFESGFDPYDFHLMIFNRYGQLIFESYNSTVGWKGTYANQSGIVQDGTYTWTVDFKEMNTDRRQKHSGFVTVLK
jgi:gliding motility-associated-like protein